MTMTITMTITILLGAFFLDVVFGEPRQRLHPVVWVGILIDRLSDWRFESVYGLPTLLVPLGVSVAVSVGVLTVSPSWLTAVLGAYLLTSTFSLTEFVETATEVTALTDDDIDEARYRLRALAGRDASDLSPGEVRSAVVESLSENFVDGFLAPVFYFGVFSLAGVEYGVGAAVGYRVINTADSMVGYVSEGRAGYVSARTDDVASFVPARLSVVVLAVTTASLKAVTSPLRQTDRVSSPNSGLPMSSLGAGLGVRLEKNQHYVVGATDADYPAVEDVEKGVRAVWLGGVVVVSLLSVSLVLGGVVL
ncbi:MAG: adenosylcobinamide-phosphate synthase CbiB [Halobacteria archaeon]|nr:adenosylcobinamide-phosphate synthase CbiB [Halobacteria archaeon]